jgi:hypothetical protein
MSRVTSTTLRCTKRFGQERSTTALFKAPVYLPLSHIANASIRIVWPSLLIHMMSSCIPRL